MRRVIKQQKDLTFVVIYTREPHARQMGFKDIAQPVTWKERQALARKTKKELNLDVLFLIDDIGDPSRKLFGDLPNPGIFVERDGTIQQKLAWAEASEVLRVIKAWSPKPEKKVAPKPGKKAEPKLPEVPVSRPVKKSVKALDIKVGS